MADSDRAVLINLKGELGKCEHHIFDSVIGSIFDDKLDKAEISSWKELLEDDECNDCAIFPNCLKLKRCFSSKPCSGSEKEETIQTYKNNVLEIYNA